MKQVKQKQPTLQAIINAAQTGGGGGDSYTKAESDAKYQTIENSYTKAQSDAKFQTIEGMINYVLVTGNYMTVNSIRIYVSASAPTGEIPEGSIWIGG